MYLYIYIYIYIYISYKLINQIQDISRPNLGLFDLRFSS